uniref:SPX domain-containing membrane protein At4g22990-like isoform X1 n=1 Tax=Rhizophora mucronata TaxID=61149 RepID=A0A2P2J8F0_RHIMU
MEMLQLCFVFSGEFLKFLARERWLPLGKS